ncbi:MAG: type II toxin-antitoxin system RelE/ParE family toxin [Planctomycetaceae bacterium]|jgi:toxin ParE1/3/4|nr:type II toxin-antitoxin system RelE/ParE family toxin [Planctomycetaceae bacterium]
MTLRPYYTLKAKKDVDEICNYFDERSDSVADRFQQQVNETVQMLCRNPDIGERFRADPSGQTRYRTLMKFRNYMIYYRRENERLQILRIVHSARDDKTLFENHN